MSLEIKVMYEVKSSLKVLFQRIEHLEALTCCDVIHKKWAMRIEVQLFSVLI